MNESSDEREGLPSASAWRRYELCAGSWQLEQEAKRLKQEAHVGSEAAARGERIHAWLAGVVDEDGNEIELREDEATTADFLMERATGERIRIFGDQKVEQLEERRLWLIVKGQKLASGQFDRVLYTPSVALLQDFKTGYSEPDPAEQNSQLKVLAVLVALHMPATLHEVVVQVVSGAYGITEARYDLPALAKAYSDVVGTLRAIQAPDAPLKPSIEACRYCPANLICQATKDLIKPIAKLQLSALPEGERAAKLLDECELIIKHIEEIRAYYHRSIQQDPKAVPGWGLEQGAPRRHVEDWPAARQKLEEFIDAGKLDQLADYSIPAVEKLLGEAIGVRGPKLKEQFANILGELLDQKYPMPALRRVSGKPKLVEVTLP